MSDEPGLITLEPERLDGSTASELVARQVTELDARYPEAGPYPALDPEEFVAPDGLFLVARIDGRPAGCGGFRKLYEGVAEFKRMFVEPWARGRGLSRRILNELEAIAGQSGYAVIRLETGFRQHEAIGLYESSGYRRISCFGGYAADPLSVCFEKTLGTESPPAGLTEV